MVSPLGMLCALTEVVALRTTGYKRWYNGTTLDNVPPRRLNGFWGDHCPISERSLVDGYKLRKLDVGRSVQAPSFTLKVLWKACFGESDENWSGRNHMFREGADYDQAVDPTKVGLYKDTLAPLAMDKSAFDRRMPPCMMEAFFNAYLPHVCVGVPPLLSQFFAQSTINTYLLLTNGEMFRKFMGNPSGFPGTLRLNCIGLLIAFCYALITRL